MIKKIFQDVMPPRERSIRQIPVSPARKPSPPPRRESKQMLPSSGLIKKVKKVLFLFLGLIIAGGVIFSVLSLLSSSEIILTPETKSLALSSTIESSTEGDNEKLKHIIITASSTKTTVMTGTGQKEFNERARGVITIYNEFSGEPQRLIKNTRFETKDGFIYRIDSSIVVPGVTTKNGVQTPGKIDVQVFADLPGEEYNKKVSDHPEKLTIPGFKGTPRFDKFYAHLKSDFTGGFSGMRSYVTESDAASARILLRDQLKAAAENEIASSIPDGFMVIPGMLFIDYSDMPDTVDGDEVTLGVSSVARAIAVNMLDLSSKLAIDSISEYKPEDKILISNLSSLEYSLNNKTPRPYENEILSMSIKGEARFVWQISPNDIKELVKGKSKSETKSTLDTIASVKEAVITLRPFWSGRFPDNTEKIEVKVRIDSN